MVVERNEQLVIAAISEARLMNLKGLVCYSNQLIYFKVSLHRAVALKGVPGDIPRGSLGNPK